MALEVCVGWWKSTEWIHMDQGVLRKVSEELPELGCPADCLRVKHHLKGFLFWKSFQHTVGFD